MVKMVVVKRMRMVRWEKIGLRAAGRGGSLGDLWVEEEMRRRRGEAESGRRRTTIN